MTATAAAIGYSTTFAIESITPGTFTTLGEVVEVTPPALSRETVDATHHGSAGGVREHIAGLRDSGEAQITLNFVPGGTAWDLLKAAYDDAEGVANYKITFPNAATAAFPAILTELSPATPMGDKMTLTAKFKLSGAATWS